MNKGELIDLIDRERITISNLTNDFGIAIRNNVNEVDVYNLTRRLLDELTKLETMVKFFKGLYFEGWGNFEKQLSVLKGLT